VIASRHSMAHTAFVARVDTLTEVAVSDGAIGFADLLHRLPSVYPTELLASLDRLAERGLIPVAFVAAARQEAAKNGTTSAEGRSLLPLPHPLDYEWRFTPDAARNLLNLAANLTPEAGDLLLFGTPGLAVEALALPISRRLSFLAENNSVTERVIALNRATGSPISIAFCSGGLPRQSADAVLLDPPWYLDFVRPMLAAAARACRPGGVVLISLPPIGTRPSAEADRDTIIRFAKRFDLDSIDYQELAIDYDTPFFERNALAAAGIHPPAQWRRGDLVVFRKARSPKRPLVLIAGHRKDWIEVSIGRMRLFLKSMSPTRSDRIGLISVVDGDVLPTVSRRDPRRRHAEVWTSGNRIFRTDNPQLLLDAAISCTGEATNPGVQPHLWCNIRERDELEQVGEEIRALAALEAQEEHGGPRAASERSISWTSSSTNFCSRSTAIVSG
jgi:SAM-dependent methyltransferase